MSKKQILQAIFFDFDGVIVDSNPIKADAFVTLFRDYDDKIVTEIVAYHRQHGGISRVEKIQYAHKYLIQKPLTVEELARWATRYSDLVVDKVINVEWIAGAKDFLDSKQGALPIFVISGTPDDELKHIIEHRKMSGYFQEVLGSPIRKPVHIRNLLSEYRLIPEHCVFVGDALTDYNGARETGLHFIGIQGEVTFPQGTTVLPDCRGLQKAIAAHFTR